MILKSNISKKIIKYLKLDKPLIIFDLETTGINLSSDKIVELAYIKIWPDGREKKDELILDPEMKISLEAMSIHGISDDEVAGKPKFRDKAQELWDIFNNCYYSGFNINNFDLPLLRREFIRVGMDFEYDTKQIIDTGEIFLRIVPRTLPATYEYYFKKKPDSYHNAAGDTEAAAGILIKQLEKHKEIRDWEFINKIHQNEEDEQTDGNQKFYWLRGEAYFAFSKYKDQPVSYLVKEDPDFLNWILDADFGEDVKNIIRAAIKKHKK